MRFEFATSTRILFGAGTVKEVVPAALGMGQRALLVTGSSSARCRHLADRLESSDISVSRFSVGREPDLLLVQEGREAARSAGCDLIIALGGGSTLDAGKAIAALLTNEGTPLDYLEVIGRGLPLNRPAAPLIAIPTTAGTGSEVSRNAVLASPEHGAKASMRSPWMYPRLAIIDPELTYTLPPQITASTGMDALTQLIEPFVSKRSNPITDALCLEGMHCVRRSLRRACLNGNDAEARSDMALAGLLGGLALANAGLGVVHGFAAAIGGMFPAPHGAICAAVLGPGMAANIQALRARAPESDSLSRYQTIAAILTENAAAAPEAAPAFAHSLCAELSIPALRSYGIQPSHESMLVDKASASSSMKGNPVALSHQELLAVLHQAM